MIYLNLLAMCFMYVLATFNVEKKDRFWLILLFLANAAYIFIALRY